MIFFENYLLIILGFILSIGTAYISFRDMRDESKVGGKVNTSFKYIFVFAIVGALMTLLSNVFSIEEKSDSTENAKKLNDSLFTLQNELAQAQEFNTELLKEQNQRSKGIQDTQNQVIAAHKQLAEANRKIVKLQERVIANVIGDGNIPRFIISGPYKDVYYYTFLFSIQNEGTSPIRGIHAEITDLYSDSYFDKEVNAYKKLNSLDTSLFFQDVLNITKEVSIGDIPINSGKRFYSARVPKSSMNIGYFLKVAWDNGIVFVDFSIYINPENEHVSFNLKRVLDGKGKPIKIDPIKFNALNF